MKKFLLTILILLFAVSAFGEGTVVQSGNGFDTQSEFMRTATFTITSDGGSVPITAFLKPDKILGWYIKEVEIWSDTDNAFTVTITTNINNDVATAGTSLFTYTTTAATTGHLEYTIDRWAINSTPKIDVVNLAAAEVCTVKVTFVR